MRLVLKLFFLKIEQVPVFIELIKNYQLKKIKKTFNYELQSNYNI